MSANTSRWILLLVPVALVLTLASRILGPSDLNHNNDQCITMALSADVAINNHWVLQRDNEGRWSRKPPLLHWLTALLLKLGLWSEFGFKLPSLLAAILTVALTMFVGYHLAVRSSRAGMRGDDSRNAPVVGPGVVGPGVVAPGVVAALCGLLYMATQGFVKHCYFLRPDMLNTMLLTLAWVAATIAYEPESRHRRVWLLILWTSIGLAFLAKGPFALIAIAYVLFGGRFLYGRLGEVNRMGWQWGLPLSLAIGASWFLTAWYFYPDVVHEVFLSEQLADRYSGAGGLGAYLGGVVIGIGRLLGWVVEGFVPWGIICLLAFIRLPIQKWRDNPLAPAMLWIAITFLFLVPMKEKGGSYLLPMFPPCAVLTALFLTQQRRFAAKAVWQVSLCSLVVLTVITGRSWFFSRAAVSGGGEALKDFAVEASQLVGTDTVFFETYPHCPACTLMGRRANPESVTTQADGLADRLADGWAVLFVDDSQFEALSSARKMYAVSGQVHNLQPDPHARTGRLVLVRGIDFHRDPIASLLLPEGRETRKQERPGKSS